MNNLNLIIKSEVSEKRYEHSVRVTKIALKLADIYNVNKEKIETAAMLHDITKEKTENWHLDILSKMNINDESIIKSKNLYHAYTGTYYISKKYNIKDEEILQAIMFHTIGNKRMNLIAKIIYIADFCDSQNFLVKKKILEIAKKDLELAIKLTTKEKIKNLKKKKITPHKETLFLLKNDNM